MRRSRYGPGLAGALIIVLGALTSWLINQLNPGSGWGVTVLVATGLAVLAAAALQFWLSTRRGGRIDTRVAAVKPADWAVPRPRELDELVRQLTGRGTKRGGAVGLSGAGGFGKTTLARMACGDPRVKRRFRGGSLELTVGQDVRGAALADKINTAVEFLTGVRPSATDPEQAGQELAAVLRDGPARVLVVDDVWSAEQLGPFLFGAGDSAVLVTTRIPAVLPADAERVTVDRLTPDQARQVLGYGIAPLPARVVRPLLAAAGGWALLLALINADLRATGREGGDVVVAARAALERLARFGPTAFDMAEAGDRGKAVAATIDASLVRLAPAEVERLDELGILAEDAETPTAVVADLWRATGGLDEATTRRLCQRLDQLSLLRFQHDTVVLHDVVRGYLRHRLGPQRLAVAGAALVDGIATRLGAPEGAADDARLSWYEDKDGRPQPAPVHGLAAHLVRRRQRVIGSPATAWWRLGDDDGYLWRHLPYHLVEAGRAEEAEALVLDLRWVGGKLRRMGPAAVVGDLAGASTPPAVTLVRVLEQSAHLLAATEPEHAVVAILLSRLADREGWEDVVALAYRRLEVPALRAVWPLGDAFDPALRRAIVWDARTGEPGTVLEGHTGTVVGCAIAPDGTWLASTSEDRTVRLWDVETGQARVVEGHTGRVLDCAIGPDGTWLVSVGADQTARVWDVAALRCLTLIRLEYALNAVDVRDNLFATVGDRGVYLFEFRNRG